MSIGIPAHAQAWHSNQDAAGAAANQSAKAAVSGRAVFVTHIFFSSTPGGTIELLDASSGNQIVGKLEVPANGQIDLNFSDNPIPFGLSKAVFSTHTGVGAACVNLAGYTI